MSLKKNPKSGLFSPSPSLNSQYPDLSDFIIHSILGSGSFGKVLHAENRETGKDLAIKVLLFSFYFDIFHMYFYKKQGFGEKQFKES